MNWIHEYQDGLISEIDSEEKSKVQQDIYNNTSDVKFQNA